MSGLLEEYCRKKYKYRINVPTEHCLNYVRQGSVSTENIALTVDIPYEILKDWNDIQPLTFVELLNAFIPGVI